MRVTIQPHRLGEVELQLNGHRRAFSAYGSEAGESIPTGATVVVVEHFPPRTLVVSPVQ